jgi:hypothetical protein
MLKKITYLCRMRKNILFIFVLVVCFHDIVELRENLLQSNSLNSVNITLQSQIDHTFETETPDSKNENIVLDIFTQPILIPAKEHYVAIWKPPIVRQI